MSERTLQHVLEDLRPKLVIGHISLTDELNQRSATVFSPSFKQKAMPNWDQEEPRQRKEVLKLIEVVSLG